MFIWYFISLETTLETTPEEPEGHGKEDFGAIVFVLFVNL